MTDAWSGLREGVYSSLNRRTLEAAKTRQQNDDSGLMTFEAHSALAQETQQVLEQEHLSTLPPEVQQGFKTLETGIQKAKKTGFLLAAWTKTADFFKDKPEMAGSMTGISLAILSSFVADPEIALRLNEASVVIGLGALAAMPGQNGIEKIALAAGGAAFAVVGMPYIDQGIHHTTSTVQNIGLPEWASSLAVAGIHGLDDAAGVAVPFAAEGVKKIARKKTQNNVPKHQLKTVKR